MEDVRPSDPALEGPGWAGVQLKELGLQLGNSQCPQWTRGEQELVSLALPQTENLCSLGKRAPIHVAGKDVALESEGLGLSSCTTLCKSLISLGPFSSCEYSCLSNDSVCLSGMSLQR